MEERIDEGRIKGAIDPISLEKTEKIVEQMKSSICQVYGKETGTGFFCKIPYEGKSIPVLMTNYHIIDDDFLKNNKELKISKSNGEIDFININEKSKIYSSPEDKYDMTIIKLKENEINTFLEIDDNLFNKDSENFYEDESIYILHYPDNNEVTVSYGYRIETINEFKIKHKCNTERGSSGGPILNLKTNKIIGFHRSIAKKKIQQTETGIQRSQKENLYEYFNIGTFLKFPLNELDINIMK